MAGPLPLIVGVMVLIMGMAQAAAEQVGALYLDTVPVPADHLRLDDMQGLQQQGANDCPAHGGPASEERDHALNYTRADGFVKGSLGCMAGSGRVAISSPFGYNVGLETG